MGRIVPLGDDLEFLENVRLNCGNNRIRAPLARTSTKVGQPRDVGSLSSALVRAGAVVIGP